MLSNPAARLTLWRELWGYAAAMRFASPLLLPVLLLTAPVPALAGPPPHSGITTERRMPELSDLALFAVAAGSLWFVRQRLRARFRKARRD